MGGSWDTALAWLTGDLQPGAHSVTQEKLPHCLGVSESHLHEGTGDVLLTCFCGRCGW